MKVKYFWLAIGLIIFNCNDYRKTHTDATDERNDYVKKTAEASLDLYCEVNNRVGDFQRLTLCAGMDHSKNYSIELIIRIRHSKIDTIKSMLVYFENGDMKLETTKQGLLDSILNVIEIEHLPTLKGLKDGAYVRRMEIERFCVGYVEEFKLDIK